MTYMLDTNICIYAIKNKPERVLKQLYEHLEDGMCISSITLAELAHGVRKSLYPEKNEEALLQFLSILDILDFDDLAAMEYGKICAPAEAGEANRCDGYVDCRTCKIGRPHTGNE